MIKKLTSGTIQGSVLGPILFSLYMAPLLQMEDLELYADNNYLGEDHETLNELLSKLQEKVNRVTKWLMDSGMKVNGRKT